MSSIIKPPKTISEQVLEVLEEEILSGFYQPGDRMVETEIAKRLGVSRGPVREALLVLESRGLLQEKSEWPKAGKWYRSAGRISGNVTRCASS